MVVILFSLAAIVLINTKEVFRGHHLNTKLLGFKKVARDAIANGFFNTKANLSFIVWPLFMFTILPGFKNIGYLEGISVALSIVVVFLAGKFLDHHGRKKFLIWTSMLYVPISIIRILAFNPISLVIIHILYRLADRANGLTWISIFHSNLSKHPRAEYVLWFEFVGPLILAGFMFLFVLLAQAVEFKTVLIIGIIFGSVCSLLSNLVSYREAEWSQIEAK